MRKRLWWTSASWLLGLVLLAVTGCSAVPDSSLPGRVAADGADGRQWEQVDVGGVASCRVLDRMAASASPSPSGALAPIRLPCLTPGPDIDLSQLRGRPVLVNLWASWCGPCREETPLLTAAHQRVGDQVQFVGVNTADAPPAATDFLEDFGVRYPQLADPEGEFLDQLRIPGLPVTLLLGADGAVLDKHIGPLEEDDLDALLASVVTS